MDKYEEYAEYYDLIHRDTAGTKDTYTEIKDSDFYIKEAKKVRGKVLELACGTGRIYLPMLKEGVDAYGLDFSKKMLEVLRKNARAQGLKARVKQGDMRNFNFKERFDLIIIPFRSFLHLETSDDQIKALKTIKKHLTPKGKLMLNFFFPTPKIIVSYGKEKKETLKRKEGNFTITDKSYYIDEPNQIVKFEHKLYKNGKKIMDSRLTLALIYKREFELLLRMAGFKKWKVYGGFNYQPLKGSKQEMVWIVEN